MADVELIVKTTAQRVPAIGSDGVVIGRIAPNETLTSAKLRQMWRETFGDDAAIPEGGWFGKGYESLPAITVTVGLASDV